MNETHGDLLVALLAEPLPRGMRCNECRHWTPDETWPEEGECSGQDERPYTSYWDGCVYWSPTTGSGLDYMGIPLASPLADKESQ